MAQRCLQTRPRAWYRSVLSKWQFFIKMRATYLLSSSFITRGRMGASKAALILIKKSHFDRTLQLVVFETSPSGAWKNKPFSNTLCCIVYSIHCIPRFFFQFQSYVLVQINESNNVLVFWPASPVPLFWLDNTIANSRFFKQSQALDLIFLCCLNRNIN